MLTLSLALAWAPSALADTTGGGAQAGSAPSQPASSPSPSGGSGPATGGQEYGAANPAATPIVDGLVAELLPDGTAAAPALAPLEVQQAVWAANEIVGKPYRYGGGHRNFRAAGYDCSGTVSYALHGGGLLDDPLDSSSFMKWGEAGAGDWITVYTNPGHAFAIIAGLRLDTSAAGDPSGAKGPRWRPVERSTKGFKKRHPAGF
jgi:cell wall-associated NlpC family hydrolase